MSQASVAIAGGVRGQNTWNSSAWRVIEGGASTKRMHSARDRMLALVLPVAIALVLAVVWCASNLVSAQRRNAVLEQAGSITVTVMPGDSLWQIACEHPLSGLTTDELVRAIRSNNGLASAELEVGMQLEVPHLS